MRSQRNPLTADLFSSDDADGDATFELSSAQISSASAAVTRLVSFRIASTVRLHNVARAPLDES